MYQKIKRRRLGAMILSPRYKRPKIIDLRFQSFRFFRPFLCSLDVIITLSIAFPSCLLQGKSISIQLGL